MSPSNRVARSLIRGQTRPSPKARRPRQTPVRARGPAGAARALRRRAALFAPTTSREIVRAPVFYFRKCARGARFGLTGKGLLRSCKGPTGGFALRVDPNAIRNIFDRLTVQFRAWCTPGGVDLAYAPAGSWSSNSKGVEFHVRRWKRQVLSGAREFSGVVLGSVECPGQSVVVPPMLMPATRLP